MNELPPADNEDRPSPWAGAAAKEDVFQAELADKPQRRGRRYVLPLILFLATCGSTFLIGPWYFVCLMTTLTAHELGHFFQAVRYRVPASLPYFIPMPLSPFGTFGAVIFMEPGRGDRRALFDIGITGPIAGFFPAVAFSAIGLGLSEVGPIPEGVQILGEPLLFKGLSYLIFGPLPEGHDVMLHPIAYAGWVGIFITALNLIPIGQLDGGHVLYALLRKRAHYFSTAMLMGAVVGMFVLQYWGWTLMLVLLALMGPQHPPTQNDDVPLGAGRIILGWIALAFIIVGFTPTPFVFDQP